MGCDIHMFPEKRESWGWRFVYRHVPNEHFRDSFPSPDRDNYFAYNDRWYWLFGQLAGVRRDGPPIAAPRGIPQDADDDVKGFMQNSDYHTPSWLTLAELQAHDWLAAMDGPDSRTEKEAAVWEIKSWLSRLAELDPNPYNVRIVFAFDN